MGITQAQNLSNFRRTTIVIHQDTIGIDSLSLVPGSVIIKSNTGKIIPTNLFQVEASKSRIIFAPSLLNQTIEISYRVLPLFLEKISYGGLTYLTQKLDSNQSEQLIRYNEPLFPPDQNFTGELLNKSGYISRGLNFGNNQDVVVNSALNMQLSGQLSEGIQVKASITDNNIPIQPEGNTQQIQEFDKVFITLYNDKTSLTLGDFVIKKPKGYFLNSQKKVMGGSIDHRLDFRKDPLKKLNISVAGAVAKGQFNRMTIVGQESVQGPYQLKGANNENYIIVLAGTEKVYIDGMLLKRGENNDYTIDYNISEITFTTHRIVTKDSRIVVEFEYSDKNYAKFTVANSNHFKTKHSDFWLNVLSEHESKNQAINADYSDDEKLILSLAGDDPLKALTYSFDSLGFSANEVRYEMRDSLGFDSVFVYSTDPNKGLYRVSFAFVGQGRGDYIQQTTSSANGRVYQWVQPQSGAHKGSYLPVKLLIAPKSQQMVTTGGQIQLKSFTQIDYELALSNFNANTYSPANSSDDIGWAYKMKIGQDLIQKDTTRNQLKLGFMLENLNKNFKAFEQFRNVEYNRDWNISMLDRLDNSSYGAQLFWKKKDWARFDYQIKLLKIDEDYQGLKHLATSQIGHNKWNADVNASWLQTAFANGKTDFIRSNSTLHYQLFETLKVGFKERTEQNKWYNSRDSLTHQSYSFTEWQAFSEWESENKNKLNLSYLNRSDNGLSNNALGLANKSQSVVLETELNSLKNQNLSANLSWREVAIVDSSLSLFSKNEQNFIGKLEHQLRLYKNAISFSTFYELSSGLELKKEFAYIEVAAGQGIYQWVDYNANGVQELNEFEVATFSDQAKYIKINIPSSEYIKAYSNQFTETVNLYPYKIWRNKSGIRKVISKFNNLLSYKVKKKINEDNYALILNPFDHRIADSSLLSLTQSIRNTFSFNKINPVFGIDYIFTDYGTKSLLTNGFDSRKTLTHGIHFRINFNRSISFNNQGDYSEKTYQSDFFPLNNYFIEQWTDKVELSYQINNNFRLIAHYQYKTKNNTWSFQHAELNELGLELKYNVANQSNIQVNIDYFNFKYNDVGYSPIAFEMLEGLMPGSNAKWSALFQTQLSKYLQLNLSYMGRVAEEGRVIHNGQAQLRAFF